jgi:hypothetical protein
MHTSKSSWNPDEIQDTKNLQIYSLKQVMKALGYEYADGWITSHPYFYSHEHYNKGRNFISVKTAIKLYNGNSVKCVFGRPPEFLTIWSFNDYQIAQAKAARITKSVKLQYCRQTKQIICQDHRIQFVLESYSRLFLNNKYLG